MIPLSWRIGDVKITKIVELETTGSTKFILPQATREAALEIKWLAPNFMNEEGRLKLSIHALVIETPSRPPRRLRRSSILTCGCRTTVPMSEGLLPRQARSRTNFSRTSGAVDPTVREYESENEARHLDQLRSTEESHAINSRAAGSRRARHSCRCREATSGPADTSRCGRRRCRAQRPSVG